MTEMDEDRGFAPPKFDRQKFINEEIRDAKATFIVVMFGVLMGLLSYVIFVYLDSLEGALVIGMFAVAAIKLLFNIVNVDVSEFKLKNWLGNALWYLLTWVAIWILTVNPPITDIVAPKIKFLTPMEVEAEKGNITTNITIEAKVTDNVGIREVYIIFESVPQMPNQSLRTNKEYEMTNSGDIYYFKPQGYSFVIGEYEYYIKAVDTNGHIKRTDIRSLKITYSLPPKLTPTITNGETIDNGVLKIYVQDVSGISKAEYRDVEKSTSMGKEAEIQRPKEGESEWRVLIDVSDLPPGTYTYEITVYDKVGNSASVKVTFRLL